MARQISSHVRQSRAVTVLSCLFVGASSLLACSGPADEAGNDSETPGPSASGGANAVTGGATAAGGVTSTAGGSGGALSTGGATGGSPGTPVDCAPIASAGFELCESGSDFCGAVFTNGAGCAEVCAAAGLACEAAHENVEGACAADDSLPSLPCDSAHQSDYCLCRGAAVGTGGSGSGGSGSGGSGSGGAPASGGASGSGGSASGGTGNTPANADCNDFTNQPIITVNKNGSGNFSTVQAAVDSLSKSNATPTQIRIAPGTYTEKLRIDRPNITLCGQKGQAASTILTYSDSSSTSNGNGGTLGTSGSASTNLSASKVSAENITFKNGTALGGGQAVALLVTGSEVQFRNCRFLGYQDTLYTKGGTQYFKDCYIEGTVDYIFGGATAVFDECTIHSASGGTAVTAPSTDQAVPYGLVFLGGKLTAASGVSSQALGRNWGAYGAATYVGTELGAHISAAGWSPMGANTLATARFSEYQTTGAGAQPSKRAKESKQLSAGEAAAYTVDNIFGAWTPTFSQ